MRYLVYSVYLFASGSLSGGLGFAVGYISFWAACKLIGCDRDDDSGGPLLGVFVYTQPAAMVAGIVAMVADTSVSASSTAAWASIGFGLSVLAWRGQSNYKN
jgi:hypothetical protein